MFTTFSSKLQLKLGSIDLSTGLIAIYTAWCVIVIHLLLV